MNDLKELLRELTAAPGVSGAEQPIVRLLAAKFSELADEVTIDPFGNLVAVKNGGLAGPRFMFAAHSDEVGGVITAVTSEGFLRYRLVGVVDPKVMPGTRLLIDARISGTVVCIPGHASKDPSGNTKPAEYIDIGASSKQEAEEWGIETGVCFTFDSPMVELNNPSLVMGKAIDNRIGCAVLLKIFENLQGKTFSGTLYGVVTIQEEIGMRGASMVSFKLQPDFAVALDTVPLDDTPMQSMPDVPIKLGAGPVLQLWEGKPDAFLGTVAHQGVSDLIQYTARKLNLPVQFSAAYGTWVTDGAAIHVSGAGIPTGFLSIPRRYGHTPNEILNLVDAQAAVQILSVLAERFAGRFNPDFLA
jgi:endoglucanase